MPYSKVLPFEGPAWIDLCRYNPLNTLPIDRLGDDVWTQFPLPVTEQQYNKANTIIHD